MNNVIVKIISSIFNANLFYYTNFTLLLLLLIFSLINIIIYRNILYIMIYTFVINKISGIPTLIVKNIENNTMYNMQELLLHFVELILIRLISSIF